MKNTALKLVLLVLIFSLIIINLVAITVLLLNNKESMRLLKNQMSQLDEIDTKLKKVKIEELPYQEKNDKPYVCRDIQTNVKWEEYKNTKLGFKISIPRGVADIVESSNAIYIFDPQSEMLKEIITKKDLPNKIEKTEGIPYAIIVETVQNEIELQNFIQKRYGKFCLLGEKKPSHSWGVYNIHIDPKNINLTNNEQSNCLVNYVTKIKYSPEKNKVAIWDVGHDATFTIDGQSIDNLINESFEFL